MKKRFTAILAVVAAVSTLLPSSTSGTVLAGPASPYYLADGDFRVLQVGQAGTIVDSWATAYPLYAMAVVDTIRLYGRGNNLYPDGIEYSLQGVPTGVVYPWQPGPTGQLLDGGTDGTAHNYASEWIGLNGIWQYDRDWKNPTLLFTTPEPTVGVTYDQVDRALWISVDEGNIQKVDMAGNVLSEFYPGSGRWGALAWEPSTDTLWAHRNGSGELAQWSKDGVLLQTVAVTGLSANIWGGEFQLIPEPTAFTLLGLGSLALVMVRRRR